MNRREHSAILRLLWCVLIVGMATGNNTAFSQSPWDYVPNQPYTVQGVQSYLEGLADGTLVRRERRLVEMRDSQGRTRIETFSEPGPCNLVSDKPDIVNLYVPLRRQFIQLLVWSKTARVMTYPGTGPIPTHGTIPNAIVTTEILPGEIIHGIYAVGTRTTRRLSSDDDKGLDVVDVQESWVSPDLKIVVFSKYTNTETGDDLRWEIQKVDRSEPDAALFEIPTDYKIEMVSLRPHDDSPPDSSSQRASSDPANPS